MRTFVRVVIANRMRLFLSAYSVLILRLAIVSNAHDLLRASGVAFAVSVFLWTAAGLRAQLAREKGRR